MKISRRELLTAAAAALTAGCSIGPGSNAGSQIIPAQKVPDQKQVLDKHLFLSLPARAVAAETIADFARARSVSVAVRHQASVDELLLELAAGENSRIDVLLLDRYALTYLLAQDLLEPVDRSLVPNTRLIASPFSDPGYDSGSSHSIGKDYTTVGYATRSANVDPSDTWLGFFELARTYPGEVSVPDDAENVIGAAMLALGHSWSSATTSNLAEVRRFLRPLRQALVLRSVAHPNRLGKRLATLAASTDFRSPPLGTRFVVPKEGAVINMRSYCISALAPDPVTAHAWLNDTLLPTVAARDTITSQRASVVAEAAYVVPAPMLVNPAIYPPADVVSNLQFSTVTTAQAAARAEVWEEVKPR